MFTTTTVSATLDVMEFRRGGIHPGLTDAQVDQPCLTSSGSSARSRFKHQPNLMNLSSRTWFGVHACDRSNHQGKRKLKRVRHGQPAVRARGDLAGRLECHSASAPPNSPTLNRIGGGRGGTEWRWRRRAMTNGIGGGRPVRFSSDLRHGVGRGSRVAFIAAKTS